MNENKPTIGSLFAGIGGFDLGFERAGFETAWQVEIDPLCRAVLGHRFPRAQRFEDVRTVGKAELAQVDVLCGGFPCQDISIAGNSAGTRPGLAGNRSGLFFQVCRILDEIQPEWVVLENVANLIACNDSRDLQTVIGNLAERGYVGCFRVLDAYHFGSPARRRRIFLVGRLGGPALLELLADAAPVEAIPSAFGKRRELQAGDAWPGYTLQAMDAGSRIGLGCELLVAESNGWDQMVERARKSESDGFRAGLDAANTAERKGAGNAVCPYVAEWIARKILKEIR